MNNKRLMLLMSAGLTGLSGPLNVGLRGLRFLEPGQRSPLLRRRTSGKGAEHGWKGDGVVPPETRQMRRKAARDKAKRERRRA